VTTEQAVTVSPTPRVRPSRLGTPSGVRRELARLYLDARRERVHPSAAAKLAYILTCLHKAIETEMVERRIADLVRMKRPAPDSQLADYAVNRERPAAQSRIRMGAGHE